MRVPSAPTAAADAALDFVMMVLAQRDEIAIGLVAHVSVRPMVEVNVVSDAADEAHRRRARCVEPFTPGSPVPAAQVGAEVGVAHLAQALIGRALQKNAHAGI